MKKLRVTVEGKVYEVLVEMLDEPSAAAPSSAPAAARPVASASVAPAPAVSAPAAPAPSPARGGAGDVPSPLAGKIVSIDVKVGQNVAEGAQLATIEAMKMNTYIFAPQAGRIDAIFVNAGDGVEEGSALLRIA